MKVLIVGGSGFIGKNVSLQLLQRGHEVTNFHRGQTQSDLSSPTREIIGDRNELESFHQEFQDLKPDVVIDMIPMCENDARTLLKTFKGIARRVVAISSADVYRNYELLRGIAQAPPDPHVLSESFAVRQNLFPYRAQAKDQSDPLFNYEKILVERLVLGDPDFSATVLRLPAVYGPGDKKHRLFPYLKRMDDGRPAIIIEKGMMNWRWTRGYVENVAAAISWAAGDERSPGRIYNVGEGAGLTETAWIRSIAEVVGWNGKTVAVDPSCLPERMRSGLAWEHQLETDTSLIHNQPGFSEPISFREGLSRTVSWDRANPPEIKPEDFDYAAEDAVLASIEG